MSSGRSGGCSLAWMEAGARETASQPTDGPSDRTASDHKQHVFNSGRRGGPLPSSCILERLPTLFDLNRLKRPKGAAMPVSGDDVG